MATDDSNGSRSALERHFNTALLALIVAGMTWFGNTIVIVDKRTAVIEADLTTLKQQAAGYYPAMTATRDFADIARRLDRLENRMDRLERPNRRGADAD